MKNNFKVLLPVFGLILAGWNANGQSAPPGVRIDPITEHDTVRSIAPFFFPANAKKRPPILKGLFSVGYCSNRSINQSVAILFLQITT